MILEKNCCKVDKNLIIYVLTSQEAAWTLSYFFVFNAALLIAAIILDCLARIAAVFPSGLPDCLSFFKGLIPEPTFSSLVSRA